MKVWLKNGSEQWVLIHLEVQGEPETNFEGRIYEYHSRLFLSYNCPVASFVILGDDHPQWKPQEYKAELENSTNPFATVVMAHLKAKETRKKPLDRRRWKLFITKRLYQKGYQRKDIMDLFHFIDWVMRLPLDLEKSFLEDIDSYEEEQKMPYITSAERIGREEGLKEGMLLGAIELGLELKFGPEGLELLPEIAKIGDLEVLSAIKEGIKKGNNLAQLRSYYQ